MIQVKTHVLGYIESGEDKFNWTDAAVNQRQKNMFGANALAVLFANYWAPAQPSWADGECFEIRFVEA